ncbi:MAG: 2-C-methyl-D-erythritol 4-phosphate cytidylyltransferase [Nitrospirales bacterium]|nr:MAG: 2-C-methyl-D-erythritol 4-phosphate cytidylyltransferase [Nitrospirales bacterium]
MSSRVAAVVPAAGRGVRMGGSTPKQFLSLGDVPLVVHSLRTLDAVEAISEVIVVIPEADRQYCQEAVVDRFHIQKVTQIVSGGRRRQDSVRHGMLALKTKPDVVVVHDGVRPFVSREIVEQAIVTAQTQGAALVAIPMKDTVKRVNEQGRVEATLARKQLWLAQTPQVFRYSWLVEAHAMAEAKNLDVTDDAGLVEQLGYPVTIVQGSAFNIKITRPEDIALGEAILSCQRTQKKL